MHQKAEGRSEQLSGYEAGSCGAGEKEEMIKMRDNGCSGCKYEHLKGSEKPCCDCANMHMDKYEPITNADRIRNMSDEELAQFLCKVKSDYQWMEHEFPGEEEHGEWEEWLRSEAE